MQVRGKNLDEVIFPHANVGTAMRIAQNLQSAKPSEKTLALQILRAITFFSTVEKFKRGMKDWNIKTYASFRFVEIVVSGRPFKIYD